MKATSNAARTAAAKVFQVPATLTSVSSTADGGLRLNFHTQELSVEDKIAAMGYHQQFGYVLFRANQFTDADIPDVDAQEEGKSPSQRLRAALFIFWKQRGEKQDFELFYRQQLEKIIGRVKKFLD